MPRKFNKRDAPPAIIGHSENGHNRARRLGGDPPPRLTPARLSLSADTYAASMKGVRTRTSYTKADAAIERERAFLEREAQRLENVAKIETQVNLFKSRLTPAQLRAGIADDIDPHRLASHQQMFGWRHGRYWR